MIMFCLAAALGAVLRHLADTYFPRRGILLVNIIGAFLAGSVLGAISHFNLPEDVATLLIGGFTGSLTTYSTVALQTVLCSPADDAARPWRLWAAHVGLSVLACAVGFGGMQAVFQVFS